MTRRDKPNPQPSFSTHAEVHRAYSLNPAEIGLVERCVQAMDYYRRKARSLPVHGPAPLTPWERIDRWGAGKPESEWLRIAQAAIECRRIVEAEDPERLPRQVA